MDVSILIISYNTQKLTLDCLRSLYATTRNLAFEIIVLDNASSDGSASALREAFPEVHLIALERNLGFAGGNNAAAANARGESLLLLNPDTVLREGAIQHAMSDLRNKSNRAIIGGRTYFGDGTLNANSCHGKQTPWSLFCKGTGLSAIFRTSAWLNPESLGRWQRDSTRQVDCITGCFLLIPRDLWKQLGGFDETFFMYGEDTDLCLRAAALGIPSWVCPEAQLIHYGGQSERIRADKMVRLFVAKSQLMKKHWPPSHVWFGLMMLDLWALSRKLALGLLKAVMPRYRDGHVAWRSIWERRSEWHAASSPITSKHPLVAPQPK